MRDEVDSGVRLWQADLDTPRPRGCRRNITHAHHATANACLASLTCQRLPDLPYLPATFVYQPFLAPLPGILSPAATGSARRGGIRQHVVKAAVWQHLSELHRTVKGRTILKPCRMMHSDSIILHRQGNKLPSLAKHGRPGACSARLQTA